MSNGRMQSVLVVDDDARIARLLSDYLIDHGYQVRTAASARECRAMLDDHKVDLVTLDLGLPDEDGLAIARELRRRSSVPIIMITGQDDVVDRVAGLEIGADDYIAKPFHMREVLARIRAVLRRRGDGFAAIEDAEAADTLVFADWRLDLATRELRSPQGETVALTSGEYDVLRALAERAPRVLSRDQLMDLVRGASWTPYDRSIDTMIGRLRKKLSVGCDPHALIKTVRGAGYMLAAPARRAEP